MSLFEEGEIYYLSTLLKNTSLVFDAIKEIRHYMFSSRVHQNIFKAMTNLAKRGLESSLFLVKSELATMKVLDESGGEEYLKQLALTPSYPNSFDEYKRIILKGFKQRELQRIGGLIVDYAGRDNNPEEIISEALKRLDKLIVNSSDSEVVQLGDVLDDLFTNLEIRKTTKDNGGITTGYPKLDLATTGYRGGELWLIGARPSMGKTTYLYNSFLNVAKTDNGVLIINREMNIQSVLERFYSIESGVPLMNIRNGDLSEEQYAKLHIAKDTMRNLPIYVDNSWIGDDNFVISTIRKYSRTKGIKVVGVDYIQLLTERSADSTHELGRISRNLKLLAGELDITNVVLSQLNREVEKRDDKRPMMSDLRQSGNLEEDADYMIALYRDEVYTMNSRKAGILEFIIRKARNGPLGTYELLFDGATVSIKDPSRGLSFNDEPKQAKRQRKSVGT